MEQIRDFRQKNIQYSMKFTVMALQFVRMMKLLVWITTNCEKFLKTEIPNYLTCFLRSLYASQEVTELDMKQQTGSKLGKEYNKAICCHPAYLTYLQSTSCEMPDWMNAKPESRLLGEISTTSDMQMILL